MKKIFSILKSSLSNLSANKMRSFLTMIGIIIGIASVVLVIAIGKGAEDLIVSQVSKMGSNLIGVLPGKSEEHGPPAAALGAVITTLKHKDVRAIQQLPDVEAATGYVVGRGAVSFGNIAETFDFMGVDPDYIQVENTEIKTGQFFTEKDIQRFSRVAVLGAEVKQKLFGKATALHKNIRVQGQTFRVLGVLKARGSSIFGHLDTQVFVPLTTAQKTLLGINYVNFIRAKVAQGVNQGLVIKRIEQTLRHRHNISDPNKDDFTVRSMAQAMKIFKSVSSAVQAFLVLVVAISLVVGGIGIMNIMLASVSERIREVGLRKALGAKERDIILHFLTESGLLALLGAVIGIAGGMLLGQASAFLIRYFSGLEWRFIISLWQVLATGLCGFLIGIVSGIYPAVTASSIPAIQALRYE